MAAPTIGTVKSGSGKTFRVAWDQFSHDVYVNWASWKNIGKAYTTGEAMTKAEAWLYNK